MLILSRKKGESIQIGDDIEITIAAIHGDQVKIGINAPKHVEIHRKEVYLEIQKENANADKKYRRPAPSACPIQERQRGRVIWAVKKSPGTHWLAVLF